MNDTLEKLQELKQYYDNNTGVGNTFLLLHGLLSHKTSAIVMSHSFDYGRKLIVKTYIAHNVITWNTLRPSTLRGVRLPLVVDNSAMVEILSAAINQIEELKNEIRELKNNRDQNL